MYRKISNLEMNYSKTKTLFTLIKLGVVKGRVWTREGLKI